jgi:membrane-associated phospholipid phosphatase
MDWGECLEFLRTTAALEYTAQSDRYQLRSALASPVGPVLHTISAPVHWSGRDLGTLGFVAAATIAAVPVEESVYEHFVENTSDFADGLERVGFYYGSPLFTVPASLAVYGSGLLFRSDRVKETGVMMAEALLLAGLIQQPLRIAVGRARPLAGEGHLSFDPFNASSEYSSFISGHTWSAFAVSEIISRQVDRAWMTIAVFLLSGITAWSRLYAGKHWLSDVVMGGAMGYNSATTVWRWHKGREGAGTTLSLLVIPNGFMVNARL